MPLHHAEPRWLSRMEEIQSQVDTVRFPKVQDTTQDREWCMAVVDGEERRFRFHDYDKIYEVPGLYEKLFYEHLECTSPSRVVELLEDVMLDDDDDPADLRVLDVGAGNGMVGDELHARRAQRIVGVDIFEAARRATYRDRPGVYDDYLVTDLTDMPELQDEHLRRQRLNCLTSVAALGFGDIPPLAFLKALDAIDVPGWMAFNVKEDFLRDAEASGFCRLIRRLSKDEIIQVQAYRRYQHRRSMTGKPLHYVAMVAKKIRELPAHVIEAFE